MIKKVLRKFFGLCLVSGIVLAIGTAGVSDINSIDFKSMIIQCLIALALIVFGFIGLALSEWQYIN